MKLIIAIALVLGMATGVMALPLDIVGEAKLTYGEISVPGSASDTVKYHSNLLINRPFEIKGLAITPYIEGDLFNEAIADDLLLAVISVGAEVAITDSVSLGVERSYYDWDGGVEDTRDTCSVKVKF